MKPRDLAVYLLAQLDEFAEVALAEMNFDDVPEGIADLLDNIQRDAHKEAAKSLGARKVLTYSNGTPSVIELQEGNRFMRVVRTPDSSTEFTDEQKRALSALRLEAIK